MSASSVVDPAASTVPSTEKVLFLPELLEAILDNVRLCDLFRAAAVCRTWKSIFEDSHQLQVKAQLKSDLDVSCYEEEFDNELGLTVSSRNSTLATDGIIYYTLNFTFDGHVPIQMTANLRRCLATRPACKEMTVHPWCCRDDMEYLINSTGITIGDVVDTARRVYAEHEHCPIMISHSRYSPLGFTPLSRYPHFVGEFQVPERHRAREEAKAKRAQAEAEDRQRVRTHEDAGWGNIWDAFLESRRRALTRGESRLKWPEFLAANKSLAPEDYQLSEAKAGAQECPRSLAGTEETGTV